MSKVIGVAWLQQHQALDSVDPLQKGAVIQAILRHANPNTTARYIGSLGLEETRGALEKGLKSPDQVIEFAQANVG